MYYMMPQKDVHRGPAAVTLYNLTCACTVHVTCCCEVQLYYNDSALQYVISGARWTLSSPTVRSRDRVWGQAARLPGSGLVCNVLRVCVTLRASPLAPLGQSSHRCQLDGKPVRRRIDSPNGNCEYDRIAPLEFAMRCTQRTEHCLEHSVHGFGSELKRQQ